MAWEDELARVKMKLASDRRFVRIYIPADNLLAMLLRFCDISYVNLTTEGRVNPPDDLRVVNVEKHGDFGVTLLVESDKLPERFRYDGAINGVSPSIKDGVFVER